MHVSKNSGARLHVRILTEIVTDIWSKLLLNLRINGDKPRPNYVAGSRQGGVVVGAGTRGRGPSDSAGMLRIWVLGKEQILF